MGDKIEWGKELQTLGLWGNQGAGGWKPLINRNSSLQSINVTQW